MTYHYLTLKASLTTQFAAEQPSEEKLREIDVQNNRLQENFSLPLREGITIEQIYNATVRHYVSRGFFYNENREDREIGALLFTNKDKEEMLVLLRDDPNNLRVDITADFLTDFENY